MVLAPTDKDEANWTPLNVHCCVFFDPEPGVQAAVDALLRCGADETAVDNDG